MLTRVRAQPVLGTPESESQAIRRNETGGRPGEPEVRNRRSRKSLSIRPASTQATVSSGLRRPKAAISAGGAGFVLDAQDDSISRAGRGPEESPQSELMPVSTGIEAPDRPGNRDRDPGVSIGQFDRPMRLCARGASFPRLETSGIIRAQIRRAPEGSPARVLCRLHQDSRGRFVQRGIQRRRRNWVAFYCNN